MGRGCSGASRDKTTDGAPGGNPASAGRDVPGRWLLRRPWPVEGGMDLGAWMASSLRLLQSVSEVLSSSGERGDLLGRVDVIREAGDFLSLGAACLVPETRSGPAVAVPESFLVLGSCFQKEALRRLLAQEMPPHGKGSRDAARSRQARGQRKSRTLVQFVNPASLSEAREREFTGIPPAAFFMAPALQRKGFPVAVDTLVLEAFAEPALCPEAVRKEAWTALERILERRPFCIGVTAMDLYADSLRAFLREVRARDPDVLLALGGPMVTLYGARAAVHLPEANVFLRGDGDTAFARVLSALDGLGARGNLGDRAVRLLSAETGLLARCGGTLLLSRFDRGNHLEEIDSVFRGRIDLGYLEKRHLRKGLYLHTLRGCPYRCAFCAKVHGSRVRTLRLKTLRRMLRALERRLREIALIEGLTETERREALRLRITDDDFLLDRRRAKSFFREAIRSPFFLETVPAGIVSFLSAGRPGCRALDAGLATCLEACRDRIGSFEIGTDDVSQRELARLAKAQPVGYGPEEVREVVAGLETLGIRNRHFVLLSNPETRWPDLFDKIVTLEQWIWDFARFLPDPNPFVLAPIGTALFDDLATKGRSGSLVKRIFSVEGYPEFTHWAVNLALPDEALFSSSFLSCRRFFERLSDLLKGPQRFSVFNDVYLQYLLCRRKGDLVREEHAERSAVWRQIQRAVRNRLERLRAWLWGRPFPGGAEEDPCRRENRMVEILWGLCLVRRTVEELFPEAGLASVRKDLEEELGRWIVAAHLPATGETGPIPERIAEFRKAARLAESHADLALDLARGQGGWDFARRFVLGVRQRLEARGYAAEAAEWEVLCASGEILVRLDVGADRREARFVEDPAAIERVARLIRLARPGFPGSRAFLPFLRVVQALGRSIQEDFLDSSSETRRLLYRRLVAVPAEFQARFGQEFGLCPFADRDRYLAVLLARVLAARTVSHDREAMGTRLFEGLGPVSRTLVPDEIERFAAWLLDSTCRTSETRSMRNHWDP